MPQFYACLSGSGIYELDPFVSIDVMVLAS